MVRSKYKNYKELIALSVETSNKHIKKIIIYQGLPQSAKIRSDYIQLVAEQILFWLRWVFVAASGVCLVAAGGGCPSLQNPDCSARTPHS